MSDFFGSMLPYLLVGVVVYLIFRAVIWLLYYKGEIRVPLWHEVGFALLAFWIFILYAAMAVPSKVGGALLYIPLGFLVPFLFRRFQKFWKVLLLGGLIALVRELLQIFLGGASFRIAEFLLFFALSLLGSFLGYFLFAILCYYLPEAGRLGTVKRSRHREVPFLVKKELEFLVLLMLLAVVGRGAQLKVVQIREEKAAQAELEKQKEAERKAAEEAEAQRLAEEEAKRLKTAETMPELTLEAGAACLFSMDEDLILYEKNAEQRVVPASTTKLLTALTVLKYCDTEEVVTAGEEINLISQGASTASLKLGTKGRVETFLGAMLVPSGNDAAYVLAAYTGRRILGNDSAAVADAVAAFVNAMNEYAAELNLEDSHFENPDGDTSENHYTTARDMVRIARACLENETILELCGKSKYRALFENMDVTYQNTNLLLKSGSEYYYEGAIGLKTGSSNDAKCLIGALEIDGRRYVTAVMQDSEDGRWQDTKTLFDEAAQP